MYQQERRWEEGISQGMVARDRASRRAGALVHVFLSRQFAASCSRWARGRVLKAHCHRSRRLALISFSVRKIKANDTMRLPRRVPWASIGELEQLCSWIYTDEHDYESKVLAINRVRL